MTNLNEVKIGNNQYCGPAVLSILTGRNTDECERVIQKVTQSNNKIRGVYTQDLLDSAKELGYDYEVAYSGNTLFGTMNALHKKDGIYIISLEKHFVIIEVKDEAIYLCDNHTKEPIQARNSARLSQRVVSTHRVFKLDEKPIPRITSSVITCQENNKEIKFIQRDNYDIGPSKEHQIGFLNWTHLYDIGAVSHLLLEIYEKGINRV